jgi:hypothetical protein
MRAYLRRRLFGVASCALTALVAVQGAGQAGPVAAPALSIPAANPFAPTSWQPSAATLPAAAPPAAPAPVPVPGAAAASPAPPPLPYKFLGRYAADVQFVLLTKNDQVVVAKTGDVLDGAWRVERIAGPLIEFTYLPLQIKQSLPVGGGG